MDDKLLRKIGDAAWIMAAQPQPNPNDIARAAITALANAPLDKSGLDAAISAYLTAQHRAMTAATGENPVEAAIKTYLTALKEAK